MNDSPTSQTSPGRNPWKEPREYSADQYMRFLIKEAPLIDNIAAHLRQLKDMLKEAGVRQEDVVEATNQHGRARGEGVAKSNLEFRLNSIAGTAQALEEFNHTARRVYTNDGDLVTRIPNVSHILRQAQQVYRMVLDDQRFNRANVDFNAALANDIEAIDRRLLAVIGDGKTITQALHEYNNNAPGRLQQLTRGVKPEDFRHTDADNIPRDKFPLRRMNAEQYRSMKAAEVERITRNGESAEDSRYKKAGLTWKWREASREEAALLEDKEPAR